MLHRAVWTGTYIQTRHGFMVADVGRTLHDLVGFLPQDIREAVVQAGHSGLLCDTSLARLADQVTGFRHTSDRAPSEQPLGLDR